MILLFFWQGIRSNKTNLNMPFINLEILEDRIYFICILKSIFNRMHTSYSGSTNCFYRSDFYLVDLPNLLFAINM